MKLLLKLLVNSFLGFVALFLFNLIAQNFGLGLGLNLLNAVVVGILGIPGFALLLILQALSVI